MSDYPEGHPLGHWIVTFSTKWVPIGLSFAALFFSGLTFHYTKQYQEDASENARKQVEVANKQVEVALKQAEMAKMAFQQKEQEMANVKRNKEDEEARQLLNKKKNDIEVAVRGFVLGASLQSVYNFSHIPEFMKVTSKEDITKGINYFNDISKAMEKKLNCDVDFAEYMNGNQNFAILGENDRLTTVLWNQFGLDFVDHFSAGANFAYLEDYCYARNKAGVSENLVVSEEALRAAEKLDQYFKSINVSSKLFDACIDGGPIEIINETVRCEKQLHGILNIIAQEQRSNLTTEDLKKIKSNGNERNQKIEEKGQEKNLTNGSK